MTDFKQFNVWYYDFTYNDKRVKTCTRVEDALAFARMLVRDREKLHVRFFEPGKCILILVHSLTTVHP